MKNLRDFKNIWVVDYEFYGEDTDPLKVPICYVAKNINTGEAIRHWITGEETTPAYSLDSDSLFIAYAANAEMSAHLALGFSFPVYILDLYAEFLCLVNGKKISGNRSLLTACAYFGVKGGDASTKDIMRVRILRGPPFSLEEREDILVYCQTDVDLTTDLFFHMQKYVNLLPALLRGTYMANTARIEHLGIPIDTVSLNELLNCWDILKEELIWRVDRNYNVYEGIKFKTQKFKAYLEKHNIPWETTRTGLPRIDDEYMEKQAKIYPKLKPLQELRYSLGKLKLQDIQVGSDNRNRVWLNPFGSKTGRNQPSNSKYIFGGPAWLRYLIKPEEGQAISYIDYSQQELGIAAALSKDINLKQAYQSGDPYLAWGKALRFIPPDGTKETHPDERALFKTLVLAFNYGLSAEGLATRAKIPLVQARSILRFFKQQYKTYWRWSADFADNGILSKKVSTKYGWLFDTSHVDRYNTLLNWPMQSTGGDILRLAIDLCFEHGVDVCGPVHDAILVAAPIEKIDTTVTTAQKCMEDASEIILHFRLRTEAKTTRYPDRYKDPRGEIMWNSVWSIINGLSPTEKAARIFEKINKNLSLDDWEPASVKPKDNLSRKRRGQLAMKPLNFSEKTMAERIEKQSGLTHIEVMHLIRASRDFDYDLEHEIDWLNQGYQSALEKIKKDTDPRRKSIRELQEEN